MSWFIGVYAFAAVVTAGLALGSRVADGESGEVFGCMAVGLLWPIMWIAALTAACRTK